MSYRIDESRKLEYHKMNAHYMGLDFIEGLLSGFGSLELESFLYKSDDTLSMLESIGLEGTCVGLVLLCLYKGIDYYIRWGESIYIDCGCPRFYSEEDYQKFVERKEKIKRLIKK